MNGSSRNEHIEEASTIKSRKRFETIKPYLYVVLIEALLTGVLKLLGDAFHPVNVALIYILPVLLCASKWSRGSSFFSAFLGVVLFDWFFVPPFFSFTVSDLRYIISFGVFIVVAMLTANLASELRFQLKRSQQRERMNAALFSLSKDLSQEPALMGALSLVTARAARILHAEAACFLPSDEGELFAVAHSHETSLWGSHSTEITQATWAYENMQPIGRGTENQPDAAAIYLPLMTEGNVYGVLGLHFLNRSVDLPEEEMAFVDALAGLAAMTTARIRSEEQAKIARLMAESERIRTALLNSISHELRTPIATVIGSVTGLLESGDKLSNENRDELIRSIYSGALRMNRLITNLLDMVRLESGMLQLHRELCDLEDIIGVVVRQFESSSSSERLQVQIENDLPTLYADEVLVEQVLGNVISNALKYSNEDMPVVVHCYTDNKSIVVEVHDEGVGLEEFERERVFDKFFRGTRTKNIPGTGLGLAIAKGIMDAHQGFISIQPNEVRGVTVQLRFPVSGGDIL